VNSDIPETIIGLIYIHPTESEINLSLLRNKITHILSLNFPTILIGDWNAHHSDWHSNHNNNIGTWTDNLANDLFLTCTNNIFCPGEITRPPHSIIDLCFTKDASIIESLNIMDDLFSDHRALLLQLTTKPVQPDPPPPDLNLQWNTSNGDFEEFQQHINPYLDHWIESFPHSSDNLGQEINTLWLSLKSILIDTAKETIGTRNNNTTHTSWFDEASVKVTYSSLKHHRRIYLNRRNPASKLRYLIAKNLYRKAANEAKQKKWSNFCNNIDHPNTTILNWKQWQKSKGKNSISPNSIPNPDRSLPSNLSMSLDNMGTFFQDLYTSPPDTLPVHIEINNSAREALSRYQPLPIIQNEFKEEEVHLLCNSMKLKTALGPDSFSPYFIKYGGPKVLTALTLLFNFSHHFCVIPDDWKAARGIPIHKKGPASDPSNFRLISVTSVVARLFEKLIISRLSLTADRQLHNTQAGFRAGRSAYDHLFIIDYYREIFKEAQVYMPVVALDICKAFDSVSHNGLVAKLSEMKVSDNLISWINQFLTNRTFNIQHINTSSSKTFNYQAGVPQGTALGPFLWNIFINDLLIELAQNHPHILALTFADDIFLIPINPNLDNYTLIQQGLDTIDRWSKKWKVVFSTTKSVTMSFSTRSLVRQETELKLYNLPLPRVDSIKYLGLTYSKTTNVSSTWTPQISKLTNSINIDTHHITRTIHPFNKSPSPKTIATLINAILVSKIAYALPFWHLSTNQINKLHSKITIPIRRRLRLSQSAHKLSLLTELGIPFINILQEKLTLQYGLRLLTSNIDHPAINIFREDFKSQVPMSTFTSRLKQTIDTWFPDGLPIPLPTRALKAKFKERILLTWQAEPHSLHNYRNNLDFPLYLQHDTPKITSIRSQLRFHRSFLNAHFHKQNTSCPLCNHHTDDIQHMLNCPHHLPIIQRLQTRTSIIFNPQNICGNLTGIPKNLHDQVLTVTGALISTILALRRNS